MDLSLRGDERRRKQYLFTVSDYVKKEHQLSQGVIHTLRPTFAAATARMGYRKSLGPM